MTWTTRPRSDLPGGLTGHALGQGPRLVLIHGVGLQLEAWNGVVAHLSSGFETIAVDMPGHGGSAPALDLTLSAFVARIEQMLEMTGPALLAGHSMGAMIALDLASRRPDLVRGVAALNAIHRRTPEAAAAVQKRAEALAAGEASDPAPTLARWFGDHWPAESAACREWLSGADREGYARAYTVFAHEDGPADDALRQLAMPALFLTGAHDPNSTPAMSRAMATLAPQGRATIIPDAAHMAPMTHPAEVARAIADTFSPPSAA